MLLVGSSTICTALARSPKQFVLWRILTGMGLGVSISNCNAWTSEYMPARRRGLALVSMNAAIGMGAFSAGIFDDATELDPDAFTDVIGRNFKEPKEGLGFDGSPTAHMWRTMIWPNNFL